MAVVWGRTTKMGSADIWSMLVPAGYRPGDTAEHPAHLVFDTVSWKILRALLPARNFWSM